MSTQKPEFCPLQEYVMGEKPRVMPGELAVGGLYVVMFSLMSHGEVQAAKYAARLNHKAGENAEGAVIVQFTTLDLDLEPDMITTAALNQNGYFIRQSVEITPGDIPVKSGYFQEYGFGPEDTALLAAASGPVS